MQLSAGLRNDLLCILLGQLLVSVVALDGLSDLRDLILRQVATRVFAVFPGVEAVIRAVRALADNRERAVLHALDLEDLLEEGLGRER